MASIKVYGGFSGQRYVVSFKNLEEFRKKMDLRVRLLRQAKGTANMKTAKYMYDIAVQLAPRSSGALIEGLRYSQVSRDKGHWQVTSTVAKAFKYNLWVNQTKPLEAISPWWLLGKKYQKLGGIVYNTANNKVRIAYGDTRARTISKKQVRWTGSAKFFDIARENAYTEQTNLMRIMMKDVLAARTSKL